MKTMLAGAAEQYACFVNQWFSSAVFLKVIALIVLDVEKEIHPKDKEYFRTSREKWLGASLEEVSCADACELAPFTKS